MAFRVLLVALASALCLAGCDTSPRRPAVVVNLNDDAAQDALANEQRADAEIEADILANEAVSAADEDRAGEAADNEFLANLDLARNEGVAAAVETMKKEDADRAKRARFDEAMRRELETFNGSAPSGDAQKH